MCLSQACGSRIGQVLYVIERLALCCAATGVVTCLMATIIIILGMGIGVGYNYCFVESKVTTLPPDFDEGPTTPLPPEETPTTSLTPSPTPAPPGILLRSNEENSNESKHYYNARNILRVNNTLSTKPKLTVKRDQSLKIKPGGLIFHDTHAKRVAPSLLKNKARKLTPLLRVVTDQSTTTSTHATVRITSSIARKSMRTTEEELPNGGEQEADLRSLLSRIKNKEKIWS